MKTFTLFFTIISVLACRSSNETSSMQKQTQDILSGNYIVSIIDNTSDNLEILSIHFNDSTKTASGFSGCNRYTGKYEITGNSIKLGPFAATRKLCQEPQNKIETEMLQALSEANTYALKENILTLYKDDLKIIEAKEQSKTTITYTASTRGFFELITISQDSMLVTNDRSLNKKITSSCSEKDWNHLLNLIQEVDLASFPSLEAPSKANQYDGAAMATLEITFNDKTYKTNIFDHGNPPESIELIVNKVLSVKKMTEKK